MERDIYQELAVWKSSPRRKPLILNGARQVGKTYALQKFAHRHYKKVAYLNFERDSELAAYFSKTLDPHALLKLLSIHFDMTIEPNNTLLIFDEVQECPPALTSLKYFCEEANQYHIAAAGSLLGVKTAKQKTFPVGKVNFLYLYPLTFFEFLTATNNTKLRSYLDEYHGFEALPSPFHNKLIELLKYYYYIGGMPEAVDNYIQTENLNQVRDIQFDILDAYERDFAKHAPPNQIMKIITVWQQVHRQLAKENKKFIFSAIRKSARGRDYEEAIQWLLDAGLIYKSFEITAPKLPLSAYANTNIFKVFMLDVGLLSAQNNLSAKTVIQNQQLFTEFKGALTENYVAQQLIHNRNRELYYWTSSGTAEVDFIIAHKNEILPLEIKAGISQRKKSLLVYGEKYQSKVLSRATLMNLKYDGKIFNYPLYMLQKFPLISGVEIK